MLLFNLVHQTIFEAIYGVLPSLYTSNPVPGSLNIEGGREFHLLLKQKMELRWNLLPPFLSNEPGTV
jgi:hypothetical protein